MYPATRTGLVSEFLQPEAEMAPAALIAIAATATNKERFNFDCIRAPMYLSRRDYE